MAKPRLYPPYSKRQRKQRGEARLYYKKYYQRHKSKIKTRAKNDYMHKKHSPEFKRLKSKRNSLQYGWRFKRLPGGGYRSNAERAKKRREKNSEVQIGFFHPSYGRGLVHDVQDQEVLIEQTDPMGNDPLGWGTVPFFAFLDDVDFDTEEGLEAFFALADADFDQDDEDDMDDEAIRLATYYRETFSPGYNMPPGPGAEDLGAVSPYSHNPITKHYDFDRDDRKPGTKMNDISPTDNNPGSAKVIPYGHDFANRDFTASAVRVAAKMAEITRGLDPGIRSRAKGLTPTVRKSDDDKRVYHFVVPGSEGKYVVKVQGVHDVPLAKSDLKVSCTCGFWQWQGPEHWAKVNGYLLGKPRGTATNPNAKDPKGANRVCKHVVAVLNTIKQWPVNR